MSVLEIILYCALGIGVTIYVIVSIVQLKRKGKKKDDEEEN